MTDMAAAYPVSLRARPIVSLIGLAFFALLGGRGTMYAVAHGETVEAALLLLLTLLVVLFAGHNARVNWFFLHSYRYADDCITEIDRVLRRTVSLNLCDVRVLREFAVLGNHPPLWRRGHALVAADGRTVRLSEALPLWGEVEGRIQGVPRETERLLWRWAL